MPAARAVAALLAAAAAALAQTPPPSAQVPPPSALAGTWVGAFQVVFALADPANADSWECLPAGSPPISVPHSMTFSPDGSVSDGSWPAVTVTASNGATYTWPEATTFAFYDFLGLNASSSILSLAYQGDPYAADDAICHYATVTNGQLLVATIGGASFDYIDQCAGASYSLPDNANNPAKPFCRPLNASSRIAVATSVVGRYSRGAASATPTGSPSASNTGSPFLSTPSPPPSGVTLSRGSPFASASASALSDGSGGSGGDGGGGGGDSGDGGGGDSGAVTDNGDGGGGSTSGGGGDGSTSGGGGGSGKQPAAPTLTAHSGAQGVASLASVVVAAFMGAALAAAFQHRNN